MESLPFDDAAFDAVVGVNAFQFAGDPRRALREAARVVRPDGRVVASLFAAPERSQGTVVHEAMSALIPPEQADDHAPYALSAPGNLEAALAAAGLRIVDSGEVVCYWRYASMDDAVVGLLCSAGGARAIQAAGEPAVRDVLRRTLAQFQDPQTRGRHHAEHVPLGRRPPVTVPTDRRTWSCFGGGPGHEVDVLAPSPVAVAGLARRLPENRWPHAFENHVSLDVLPPSV